MRLRFLVSMVGGLTAHPGEVHDVEDGEAANLIAAGHAVEHDDSADTRTADDPGLDVELIEDADAK